MSTTSKYETRLFSIADLVTKLKAGEIQVYGDVVGPAPPQ
jgi:hypothetical protein